MTRKIVLLGALAAVSFCLTLPSSALAQTSKPLFANVSTDAQCTVTAANVLVDAGLIQKDAPSSGPQVSQVVFSLEQHFPNLKDWTFVVGSNVTQTFTPPKDLPLLPAGERYDVTTQTYSNVCSLVSPTANAVRAVVQITVDNANPKRPAGLIHTGRCVSFPNPCR